MTTAELTLYIPASSWISSNDRMHWRQKAKRTAEIREAARLIATNRRRDGHLPILRTPVKVTAYIGYSSNRKADPHNSQPTIKAALDGITDSGFWPDDSSKYVSEVAFRRDERRAKSGYTVRLVIEEEVGGAVVGQGR